MSNLSIARALSDASELLRADDDQQTEERDELERACEESFQQELEEGSHGSVAGEEAWRGLDESDDVAHIALGDTPELKSCGICLEPFAHCELIKKLRCCGAHAHRACMEKSLCVSSRCPFCRSVDLLSTSLPPGLSKH
jgi:hypothetical protein